MQRGLQMGDITLNPAERFLKSLMGILTVIFIGTAFVFIAFSGTLVSLLNSPIGKVFKLYSENVCQVPEQRLYVTLSVSLMVVLIYLCFLVWKNPRKNLALIPIVLASKLTSSLMAVLYFAKSKTLVNLTAFITDFPIFVIVLIAYLWVLGKKKI